MRNLIAMMAATGVLATAPAVLAADLASLPQLSEVAPAAQQISPHVPHMGTHWANPADLPSGGPIYCVIEGRVVCVEYMLPAAAFANGQDFTGLLPGITTPPITHIDIEYKPDGVGPVTDPLYQIHIYFLDQAALAGH